jgi:hypothetical protein
MLPLALGPNAVRPRGWGFCVERLEQNKLDHSYHVKDDCAPRHYPHRTLLIPSPVMASTIVDFSFSQAGSQTNSAHREHKRAYMACIPCRRSKAKCEVSDSVGRCVKCQRERRECVFSAERSTKKRQKRDTSEKVSLPSVDWLNIQSSSGSGRSSRQRRTSHQFIYWFEKWRGLQYGTQCFIP